MKHNAIMILIGAVIVTLLVAGCTTVPPTVTPTPSPTVSPSTPATPIPTTLPVTTVQPPARINGTWTLISSLAGLGASNVLPGTTITATFSDSGTVSGSAGCNNYVATYRTMVDKLTIGKLTTSTTNCRNPAGIMDQESIYLTNLQGAANFTINGDQLVIFDESGKSLLTYQRGGAAATSLPIAGITWNLEMFRQGSGSSVPPAAPATVLFGPAGNLTGNAGCNSYSGGYTTSGSNGISIGPLATTLMYCGDPGVMDQETAVLTNLRTVASYEVTTDGMLNLRNAAGTPVLVYSG